MGAVRPVQAGQGRPQGHPPGRKGPPVMAHLRTKQPGQALVFVALLLTFFSMLVLTCVEVAARYQELAQIEDALKQATRSSVQAFDYAAFARNGQRVRETGAISVTGCASLAVSSA